MHKVENKVMVSKRNWMKNQLLLIPTVLYHIWTSGVVYVLVLMAVQNNNPLDCSPSRIILRYLWV
jgi:hypothetical protein